MGLRMKNLNILSAHWKIRLLEGGVHKKPIEGGGGGEGGRLPKKGAWTVCRFKGGAWQEREVVFLRGG